MSNYLVDIFGNKENDFSKIFAFSLAYVPVLKKWIFNKCGIQEDLLIDYVFTEMNLDSIENRIDIFINIENGYCLGIENKKNANFTKDQLKRYMNSSHFTNPDLSKLVLLTPSRYVFDKQLLNNRVIWITYKDVINILLSCNEKGNYLKDLIEYFSEVEMKGIELDEIKAQIYYNSGNKKLEAALNDIRNEDDWGIENRTGSYKLFGKKYGNYTFYIGYRYSSDWYVNCDLLDGVPECIFYLRQYKENSRIDNILVNEIRDKIKNIIEKDESTRCDVMNGEVKLIIRTSLKNFEKKPLNKVSDWFRRIDSIINENIT